MDPLRRCAVASCLLGLALCACAAPGDDAGLPPTGGGGKGDGFGTARVRLLDLDRLAAMSLEQAQSALDRVKAGEDGAEDLRALFPEAEIASLTEPARVEGAVARVGGGGWIELYGLYDALDSVDDGVHRESDDAYRARVLLEPAAPLSLTRPGDDPDDWRLVPGTTGFDALLIYCYLERAERFFAALGEELPAARRPVPFYLQPTVGTYRSGYWDPECVRTMGAGAPACWRGYRRPMLEGIGDNAYADDILGFMLASSSWPLFADSPYQPGRPLVPVYYDPAVMPHEYAHLVIEDVVGFRRESNRGRITLHASEVYAALHEALADVFAALVAGTSRVGPRDLAPPATYAASLVPLLDTHPAEVDWRDLPGVYAHSLPLAHAVWAAAAGTMDDREATGRWLLAALGRLRAALDRDPALEFATIFRALHDSAPDAKVRDALCRELGQTFAEVSSRPGFSPPEGCR